MYICVIMVTHTCFFYFVIIFEGCFVKTLMFWKFFCDLIMKL